MPDVGLVVDPVFERHDTGTGHPERPARARRIRELLAAEGLTSRCVRLDPEAADDALLLLAHDAGHVRRVREACSRGERVIDSMDTAIGAASERVARLAAGSFSAVALGAVHGEWRRGFAVVRPPGHHAERDLAMGFCLFNNVAIAARALQRDAGLERVLIVDWDVHHGNGTQHLFEDDPSVFYFSLHQWPLYPGTGAATERGTGAGLGTTLNCPLPPGTGDDGFLGAIADRLVPSMESFRPEFVLVSAGFDAHRDDPLGGLAVSTGAYAEATRLVIGIAERHARGRLASVLEGGYDLEALAASAAVHLRTLLDEPAVA